MIQCVKLKMGGKKERRKKREGDGERERERKEREKGREGKEGGRREITILAGRPLERKFLNEDFRGRRVRLWEYLLRT